jgi:cytochrome c551/c552
MSRCTEATRAADNSGEAEKPRPRLVCVIVAGAAALLGLAHPVCAGDKAWTGLGRAATPAEIAAWDIDVRPDGTGLPKGCGSVADGEAIYEAQCASCHGSFGESNQYLQLAGGVGSLATEMPVRTTGSKLNYATTLWDYINRAMPFQAPKSLNPDQVYALTAYVLYLNEILHQDATLDEKSILQLRMPNRDGFTTEHGFMRVDGKPDVAAEACMQDCPVDGKITSSIPEHARNAHGNLAEQFRRHGAYRGADTTRTEPVGPLAAAKQARATHAPAAAAARRSAAELARQHACTACHGIDQKVVGPGFREVARKYMGDAGARQALLQKVKNGGAGVWGSTPMPAQPQVDEVDLKSIIDWVLAGAR